MTTSDQEKLIALRHAYNVSNQHKPSQVAQSKKKLDDAIKRLDLGALL